MSYFTKISIFLCSVAILFTPMIALAQPGSGGAPTKGSVFDQAAKLLGKSSKEAGLTAEGAAASLLVSNLINYAVGFLGVVAVLLIVYAGGLWLTAAGSDEKVGTAKKIIKSTVIGIIIVGLAYAITTFIISLTTQQPTPPAATTQPQ